MSTGVNVLRYSALGFGIFYGFSHQRVIRLQTKVAEEKHEFQKKQDLISQAKAEYAKKNAPQSSGDDVISNPEDPNFDLEKFLNKAAESQA